MLVKWATGTNRKPRAREFQWVYGLSPRLIYTCNMGHTWSKLQCGAVITWSIFTRILTKDSPYFARKGEVWSVFCEFNLWCIFCFSRCHTIFKIMSCWRRAITALDCIWFITCYSLTWTCMPWQSPFTGTGACNLRAHKSVISYHDIS